MLRKVIFDFKEFLFFFGLILFFLSIGYTILQVGDLKEQPELAAEALANPKSYPSSEYQYLKGSVANLLMMFRTSTADFSSVETSYYIADTYNGIFWVFWLFAVLITLIFINFLIAKAVNSYEIISEHLDEYITKDRAGLIAEADEMKLNRFKNEDTYP